MNLFQLKKKAVFEKSGTYSICLRGARSFDKKQPLIIYAPNYKGEISSEIISQRQYRFDDLSDEHCKDNYDEEARNTDGLLKAMMNSYFKFDTREIVTVVQFKLNEHELVLIKG